MQRNQKSYSRQNSVKDGAEKLNPTGALAVPGDQVVASIEAPIDKRKAREDSFQRKESEAREVIDYKKSKNRKSGYEEKSEDGRSKSNYKNSNVLDKKSSGVKKTKNTEEGEENDEGSTSKKTTSSDKCPFWLKVLLGIIALVALAGLGYWFFFKRGKTPPNKVKTDDKATLIVKTPHVSHPIPITDSKIEPTVSDAKTGTVTKQITVTEKVDNTGKKQQTITSQVKKDGKLSEVKETKEVKVIPKEQKKEPVVVEVKAKHLRRRLQFS